MKLLASVKVRVFLVCWVLYSVHFATNVVREHYPAFAFIEHGDFKLDEYQGFHSDIFVHTDGHSYIGNQVAGSLPAIPPLLVFDPVLDWLEEKGREQVAKENDVDAAYETEYPNRQLFFKLVKQRGLHLRFGASTAITSVLTMAPLSAALVVLLLTILLRRGVPQPRAVGLSLIFAFGTPIFYRAAYLNHNLFMTICVFASFWLIWPKPGDRQPLSPLRRFLGGFLAGWGLALDYAGAITLLALYGYLLATRWRGAGFKRSFLEGFWFVWGTLPPIGFLLFTQWAMYGDPFLPGQYHMPEVNFTEVGWRGLGWPSWRVFSENLVSLNWGLIPFGPLLVLAVVPVRGTRGGGLVIPRRERLGIWALVLSFLVFCAANAYSLMQWNTGFRYLLPIVPFLFLLLADHLARWPAPVVWAAGGAAVLHTWVLSMVRYTKPDFHAGAPAVPECWRRVLTEGVQLPWLTVLRQTTPDPGHLVHGWYWPYVVIAAALGLAGAIWRAGARAAAAAGSSATE